MPYPHKDDKTACLLSFMTQKGGMGKTTLTQLTSLHLYYQGYRVLVVDADSPQHSFDMIRNSEINDLKTDASFLERFIVKGLPPLPLMKGLLVDVVDSLAELKKSGNYDYIFVDVPGTLAIDGLEELVEQLDIILVPMEMDMKSFVSGLQTLDYIVPINPAAKLFLYWNRIKQKENESMIHDVNKTITDKHTITVLKKRLADLVSIKRDTSTLFPPTQKDVLSFLDELADYRIGTIQSELQKS